MLETDIDINTNFEYVTYSAQTEREIRARSAHLRRKHAKVPGLRGPGRAIARASEIGSAGGLNVRSEPRDANDLDEGNLDRRWRRYINGIHGIIVHPLTYRRLIHDNINT